MTTVVSTAIGLVIDALNTPTPVCSVIGRTRLRPLDKATEQAVIVRPLAALPAQEAGVLLETGLPAIWEVRLLVEIYGRAPAADSADEAIDQLLQDVFTRLCTDTLLGGQGLLQPADVRYEYAAEGENTVCAQLAVAVRLHSSTPANFTT